MTDYREYLWVEDFGFFTSDGYCLALIAESTPEEILSSLQSSADQLTIVGAQEAIYESCRLTARHDVDGVNTQLLTVAEMPGGWTMLLQAPGFFGVSAAMSEIVTTHDVVCHGADRFSGGRGVSRESRSSHCCRSRTSSEYSPTARHLMHAPRSSPS